MVLVKANKQSEAGAMPPAELMEQMSTFNQDLIDAGVMLDANGLLASTKGARVTFSGTKLDEAVEWPAFCDSSPKRITRAAVEPAARVRS